MIIIICFVTYETKTRNNMKKAFLCSLCILVSMHAFTQSNKYQLLPGDSLILDFIGELTATYDVPGFNTCHSHEEILEQIESTTNPEYLLLILDTIDNGHSIHSRIYVSTKATPFNEIYISYEDDITKDSVSYWLEAHTSTIHWKDMSVLYMPSTGRYQYVSRYTHSDTHLSANGLIRISNISYIPTNDPYYVVKDRQKRYVKTLLNKVNYALTIYTYKPIKIEK